MQDVTEASSSLKQVVFREALKQPRAKASEGRERIIIELLSVVCYLPASPHSISPPCIDINCILQMRNRLREAHPAFQWQRQNSVHALSGSAPRMVVKHAGCEVSCRCYWQSLQEKNAASRAVGKGIKPILEQVCANSSSHVAMKAQGFKLKLQRKKGKP